MIEFLIEKGADVFIENKEGWNALDVAILKTCYHSARLLYKNGLRFKDPKMYLDHLRHAYDLELFIDYVQDDKDVEHYGIFYE